MNCIRALGSLTISETVPKGFVNQLADDFKVEREGALLYFASLNLREIESFTEGMTLILRDR